MKIVLLDFLIGLPRNLYHCQHINIMVSPTVGPSRNRIVLEMCGFTVLFVRSFVASVIGCDIPTITTLLGPLR